MRRALPWLSAVLLSACASTRHPPVRAGEADSAFRTQPPAPGAEPVFIAPIPGRAQLDNGLTVLTSHRPELPLVNLTFVVRTGSAADPAATPGLAGFVGDMLLSGTTSRSAEQLASEIESLGASLHIGVSEDSMSLSVTALTANFPAVFDVVADVLQHPAFAADELERVRRQRLAALTQRLDDPRAVAGRILRRELFASHPYGHDTLGEASAIERIDRAELLRFFQAHVRPANAVAIVVGSLDDAQARAAVAQRLEAWRGATGATAPPAPAADSPGRVVLVGKPGAPQSQLRIGHVAVARDTPDYFALVVANAILGGSFNSRINLNLREDKGYTYGAHSQFDFLRSRGPFVVATAVETTVTGAAIREVLTEIERMRTEPVTPAELSDAKSRYTLSLPSNFETAGNVAGMLANIWLYELPLDYFRRLPAEIAKITAAQVQEVATRNLHPEQLVIVVVGDDAAVGAQLQALERGMIQFRDAAGNPL